MLPVHGKRRDNRHGLHDRANGSELRRIHPDEPFL